MRRNTIICGSSELKLQEDKNESEVEIIREGNWLNSFKKFRIKKETLQDFVKNFENNVLKQTKNELQFNYGHRSDREAAGWITSLRIKGRKLLGTVRWTEDALRKIRDDQWRFVSAEIALIYEDSEKGDVTENVLFGAGLTNTPFVSNLKPVKTHNLSTTLSDEDILFFKDTKNMDAFKKMLSTLTGNDVVSLAEVEMLKGFMISLSEEEKEEVKEEVEKVEEKAAKQEEKQKEEAKKEKEEKEKELSDLRGKNKTMELSKDEAVLKLATELKATQENLSVSQGQIDKMQLDARTQKISREVEKLADTGKILPKDMKQTVEMALSQSEEKSNIFLKYLGAMPARVDFSEIGSSEDPNIGDKEEKAITLAKEAFEKNPEKDYEKHLSESMKKLGLL